jgi:hypothetical protein
VTREFRRPTPAQTKARERNWKIRCLRSLWAQAGHLTGPRLRMVRKMIDFELIGLGAEPETARREPPAHD